MGGWVYVPGTVGGIAGSIQFKHAEGAISGSSNLTFITSSSPDNLYVTGNVDIKGDLTLSGTLTANTYRVQTTDTSAGSTIFGNSSDDLHQITGSVYMSTDLYVGDDLSLTSNSSVLNMGAGNDFTITHDGTTGATIAGNPVNITAGGASTWKSTAGAITVDSEASTVTVDGHTGVTVQSSNSGEVDITSAANVDINATTTLTIDAGGAGSIDFAGDASNITLTTDGAAEDFTISLAGATDSSLILSSTGTGADALQIATSAGGIDITNAGASGEDLDLSSTDASVNISGGEAARDAVFIGAGASGGGIQLQVADADGIAIMGNASADTYVTVEAHDTAGSELVKIVNSAGTTDGSDDAGAIELSAAAGGIGLAWADTKVLWAEGGQVVMTANQNTSDAILLHADSGSSQTITVTNDEGTNAAAIGLAATAGGITLDAALDIVLDADGDQISMKFGGADGQIDFSNANSGDGIIRQMFDAKDLVIQQYDGSEVVRFTDDRKLKFYDNGGEYISGDGNYLYYVTAPAAQHRYTGFIYQSGSNYGGAYPLAISAQVTTGTYTGGFAQTRAYGAGTLASNSARWQMLHFENANSGLNQISINQQVDLSGSNKNRDFFKAMDDGKLYLSAYDQLYLSASSDLNIYSHGDTNFRTANDGYIYFYGNGVQALKLDMRSTAGVCEFMNGAGSTVFAIDELDRNLYFYDKGGEYIKGDGNNLIAAADVAIQVVHGNPAAGGSFNISSSAATASLSLTCGDRALHYSAISFLTQSVDNMSPVETWAMHCASRAYEPGVPDFNNTISFVQKRDWHGNVLTNGFGLPGHVPFAITNSGSVCMGKGVLGIGATIPLQAVGTVGTPTGPEFVAYIASNPTNTSGSLYASGSIWIKTAGGADHRQLRLETPSSAGQIYLDGTNLWFQSDGGVNISAAHGGDSCISGSTISLTGSTSISGSTTLTGHQFGGFRREIISLDNGSGAVTRTLTKKESGAMIFVDPSDTTASRTIRINLPAMSGNAGACYDIIITQDAGANSNDIIFSTGHDDTDIHGVHWWGTDGDAGGNFDEIGGAVSNVSKITFDVSAGSDAMMAIGNTKVSFIADGTDWYMTSFIPINKVASGITATTGHA